MNKLVMALGALMLLGTSTIPALAETDPVDQAVRSAYLAPFRLAGVVAGVGIGVPVAVTRVAIEKTNACSNDIYDKWSADSSSSPDKVSSTILALPCGLTDGVIEGPYYGVKNAVNKGFDHPFSAESLSLGLDNVTK